ncbi:MAG: signal recognition particle-docking protein FtsY [Planctomycetaceae bacterium]|nr:signal recognition particle-docking protein FtsY [Planctomycetaceae bacterium]
MAKPEAPNVSAETASPATTPAPPVVNETPASDALAPQPSFFGKLAGAVAKTRRVLSRRVAGLVGLGQKIDEDLLEQLEEALIEADMGVESARLLMEDIRKAWKGGEIETGADIFPFLKADLKHRLSRHPVSLRMAESGPTVILVVGVNGAGKTTSIAKLAWIMTQEGRKVLLAAGDTFRAAAVEQLVTWSKRIGCEIVTGKAGADPASVAYQGCERAVKESFDVLIIDTAGRLHTQKNLMDELAKVYKVIGKVVPNAPHETILVLDSTTGQNAINQARMFTEVAGVSGIFLAKLDGTAKGGAVLTIDRHIGIPVKFVGLGESFEDIQRFNAAAFVDALFEEGAPDEQTS